MRADQLITLREIQEEVCDVFIEEAQTRNWPALDTKEGRGDRYWLKGNALRTLELVQRIENVLALRQNAKRSTPGDEDRVDDLIRSTREQASKLLDRVRTAKG